MHCEAARQALAAGKHVMCEKPMALTAEDCDLMVQAAREADRQLLIGQVLPFFAEYSKAIELIRSGQYGKLLGGTFKRVISDPLWLDGFYDPATVGGPLIDLHVHDAHLIRLLFGMPASLHCVGRMRGEVVEYCNTVFQFDDPKLAVSAASGVINQQGRPFTHGFEIHLENATLQFEFAVMGGEPRVLMPLTLLDGDGNATPVKLHGGDDVQAFASEIEEVARAIHSGQPSELLGCELARDAIVLCQRQTESVRQGGPIAVQT